jgi:hypothetical protein
MDKIYHASSPLNFKRTGISNYENMLFSCGIVKENKELICLFALHARGV